MTIEQLKAIIDFANVNPDKEVRVRVNFSGSYTELCRIISFNTYDDGIALNIVASEIDKDAKGETD